MYISRSQFKRIRHLLPKPRGSRRISHYRLLNALAYMASNGCKWRFGGSTFTPAAAEIEPVVCPSLEPGLHHRQSTP